MKMRIELDPGMPLLPSPDKTPRVAMGTDFRFFAGIGNGGIQDLMIEDPKGTQHILIHVLSPEDTTENYFLLNPSKVDPVGEVTAPPHEEIPVKPGTYATFRFSLFKTMMDRCLAEGLFTVSFSYGDSRSKPVTLISVFAPASVEPLLLILDGTENEMWVRQESLKLLRHIKPDFAYDFAKPDSHGFMTWWSAEKGKPEVMERFRTE